MRRQYRGLHVHFRVMLVGLLALVGLSLGRSPVTRAAAAFVINTHVDAHDANPLDNACLTADGMCTLRAAIEQANTASSPITITFANLQGATLTLGSLGPIIWTGTGITLDGGAANITISGAALATRQSIIAIAGNNNVVRSLTIRDAPRNGVEIGNIAGTGDGASGNTLDHVVLVGNGGAAAAISGEGGGVTNNRILDSQLGTAAPGVCTTVPAEANYIGVYVGEGAQDTEITRSTISCNRDNGIFVNGNAGKGTARVLIADNPIVGNLGAGIVVHHAAREVTIQRNLISGNLREGIYISGASSQATIQGNLIGTDASGLHAVPNGGEGVYIGNSTKNRLGGPADTDRNVISANKGTGIWINGAGAVDNIVDGNYIGVAGDGATSLGNGGAGIAVTNGATRNRIRPEVIGNNAGQPIDLADDGLTPNDAGDNDGGPNMLLNYPYITSAVTSAGAMTVYGKVCSGCTVYIYRTTGATWTPGMGGVLLATVTATDYDWSAVLPSGVNYRDIILLAIDSTGNSSEMSPQPSPLTEGVISPGAGDEQKVSTSGFAIEFPAGAVSTDITVSYAGVAAPPQPFSGMNVLSFNLDARTSTGEPVTQFHEPYTLIVDYTDEELAERGIDETTLNVAFWNDTSSQWENMMPCPGCGVDTINNRVTIVADHFTEFLMIGKSKVYLPLVVR